MSLSSSFENDSRKVVSEKRIELRRNFKARLKDKTHFCELDNFSEI